MNCTNIRDRLPDLLYEDLPPDEMVQMQDHLAQCPGCQGEYFSLQALRRALDAVASPDVSVDLPVLYRRIADLEAHARRRWRRTALAVAGLAAAVIAVLALRLEIRLGSEQVVIRWGKSTPVVESAANPKPDFPVAGRDEFPDAAARESELQPLRGVIYALAEDMDRLSRDVETRDRRLQQAIGRIQENMVQFRLMMQRQVNARQVAFDSSNKGDNP